MKSFIREVVKHEGEVTVHYTLPIPPTIEEMEKAGELNIGAYGGPGGIRTLDLLNAIEARSQLRHRPTATPEHCPGYV